MSNIAEQTRAAAPPLALPSAAKAALETPERDWSIVRAMALVPAGKGHLVGQTLDGYLHRLRPLKLREPMLNGPASRSVAEAFAPLCAKMSPSISEEKGHNWMAALVLAFSDLPPAIVRDACAEAVHEAFAFPADMEAKVRAVAERRLARHSLALARLRQMQAEILGASTPALPAPDNSPPLTRDEIRVLTPALRRLGLTAGAILQPDLDAIEAEERDAA